MVFDAAPKVRLELVQNTLRAVHVFGPWQGTIFWPGFRRGALNTWPIEGVQSIHVASILKSSPS